MKTKKLLVVLLFCTLFVNTSCETIQVVNRPEWRSLPNIAESNGRYDDVFFLNENLGWAIDASSRKVYKSTDGGMNWTQQLQLPSGYFRNIEFLNENIGFLGTLSNNFYKTSDGGLNWELVTNIPGPIEAICGLDAVGNSTVYGCGAYFSPAYIIKSTDSGNTWQYIDMSQYAEKLVEILFVDENTGYASGASSTGGIILKTTNGGTTWTEIYNTGIAEERVWKLQILFSDSNIMFGSVESHFPLMGKLVKSSDGGVNWISRLAPEASIQAVGFITPTHGWMGGHNTGFYETFDSGQIWTKTQLGGNLNRIQIFNENLAYCSGNTIYKYSDDDFLPNKMTSNNTKRKELEVSIDAKITNNSLNFSINFERENHIILSLFDSDGKLVKKLKSKKITAPETKSYSFPFPYQAGTYYLNINDDTGAQSEMIIKN